MLQSSGALRRVSYRACQQILPSFFLKMPLKPYKNHYTKCELPVSATLRCSMRTKGSTAVQRREPNIALNMGLVRRSWAASDIPQGPNLTSSRVSRPSTRDPIPWKPAVSLKG
ncbi:hypothetical protein QL093DRAFT_2331777 [Fusarium oxysporum]|nr:hypothetical protein QL093DRAFT_2331777 [Fusarium oxysporum]